MRYINTTTHRTVNYKNDIKWDEKFELLKEYKEEFGDCNVPTKFIYKREALGTWVEKQRQIKNGTGNGYLDSERIQKLNSIGFIWDINKYQWDEKFELLKEYTHEFGDCNVPTKFIYRNETLGTWVVQQRCAYKGIGNTKITQEKINKLNSIGFIWDAFEYQWDKNYNLLKEYKEKFGNCNVPSGYKYKDTNLGTWVSQQRCALRRTSKIILSNDKIDKLNSIGFIWDPFEYQWDEKFELLKQYKEEFGNCNVPYNYKYKDVNLGKWVFTQRIKLKERNISLSRIDKLNSIGFRWWGK